MVNTNNILYGHYGNVRDAITAASVTSSTRLASLAVNTGPLQDVTGIARMKARCRLVFDNGDVLPISITKGAEGYDLHLGFNHLAYAPCVRLECSLIGSCHTLVLEFHFRSCDGKQLRNFRTSNQGSDIQFDISGASSSGFNNIPGGERTLSPSQRKIINTLRALRKPNFPRHLKMIVATAELQQGELPMYNGILSILPGGTSTPLPSLAQPEYHSFGPSDELASFGLGMGTDSIRKPHQLMNGPVKFPMVPLGSGDTFASAKEAAIELAYGSYYADQEPRLSLSLWTRGTHTATLFREKKSGFVVCAVKFGYYGRLREPDGTRIKYRLPRDLFVNITFDGDLDKSRKPRVYSAYLESEPMGLPPSDAHFVITSHGSKWFRDHGYTVNEGLGSAPVTSVARKATFAPHYPSFTLNSQMQTAKELLHPSFPHKGILLNQEIDKLPDVDILAGLDIDSSKIQRVEQWLRSWRDWNPEQLQLIDKIHAAKGRMVLADGVAGTGKTLLQSALGMFFAKLGLKVAAFAPANTNTDHNTEGLHDYIEEIDAATGRPANNPSVRVCRVYPTSQESSIRTMSKDQARHRHQFHAGGASSSLKNFEFLLHDQNGSPTGVNACALENLVLEEARNGSRSLIKRMRLRGGQDMNVWDVLREYMQKSLDKTLDRKNETIMNEYELVYEVCKGNVLATSDIFLTTTGNARCDEFVKYFVNGDQYGADSCEGIVVIIDEATKDLEINIWNAICAAGDKVVAVFLLGDRMQLSPVNTSQQGSTQFNIYGKRNDISLPSRLIREGFPYVWLKEQQRMHPCLSRFSNQEFYNGQLRDGRRVRMTLQTAMPGLDRILHSIIAKSKSFRLPADVEAYHRTATDEQARHHYIEVEGPAAYNNHDSKVVKAHIEVFFKHIFPDLQAYWGSETEKNLMIICAYSYARKCWKQKFYDLQEQQRLPASNYPRVELEEDLEEDRRNAKVYTIDSAQGQESFMVVMDGSFQYRDRDQMGFMKDRGRCNVAMTQAKGVFWIIGGPLELKNERNHRDLLSPFPKLKREMQRLGRVHKFDP